MWWGSLEIPLGRAAMLRPTDRCYLQSREAPRAVCAVDVGTDQ